MNYYASQYISDLQHNVGNRYQDCLGPKLRQTIIQKWGGKYKPFLSTQCQNWQKGFCSADLSLLRKFLKDKDRAQSYLWQWLVTQSIIIQVFCHCPGISIVLCSILWGVQKILELSVWRNSGDVIIRLVSLTSHPGEQLEQIPVTGLHPLPPFWHWQVFVQLNKQT